MVDVKISQLPAVPDEIADTDLGVIVQSGTTYRASGERLRQLAARDIPANTLPMVSGNGTFVASSLTEIANLLLSGVAILAPQDLGFTLGASHLVAKGITPGFTDSSRDMGFNLVVNESTTGSGVDRRAFYYKPDDDFTEFTTGAAAAATFTEATLQFETTVTSVQSWVEWRDIQRAANSTEIQNANFIIRRNSHTDSEAVFDYARDRAGRDGFTLAGGTTATFTDVEFGGELLFHPGELIYITITGDGSTPLNIVGENLAGSHRPHGMIFARNGEIVFLEDSLGNPTSNGQILSSTTAGVRSWIDAPAGGTSDGVVNSASLEIDANNNVNLTLGRSGSLQDLTTSLQLVAGPSISITPDAANGTITFNVVAPTPPTVSTDLRFGLSDQSDPALVDFSTLTDVADPTDPQTVSTGVATAGQYYHIFTSNTHEIVTITDTILAQTVYNRDGAPEDNAFALTSDTRTEGAVTYDALSVGPLAEGVNEEYVVRFS